MTLQRPVRTTTTTAIAADGLPKSVRVREKKRKVYNRFRCFRRRSGR